MTKTAVSRALSWRYISNSITSPLKKPLDSFNATIEDIIVLHPAEVRTGYKRRNVREGPVRKKKQALPVQK
jgi:hypothetical protein